MDMVQAPPGFWLQDFTNASRLARQLLVPNEHSPFRLLWHVDSSACPME
jgi:hypothetical protein